MHTPDKAAYAESHAKIERNYSYHSQHHINVPLNRLFTFDHHRGEQGKGITAERLWHTSSPVLDYTLAFCQANNLPTPNIRGSSVRYAAFWANAAESGKTPNLQRYTPNAFMRGVLLPKMQPQLEALPRDMQNMYRSLLAEGPDLDVKLPYMDDETSLRFVQGLMLRALPQLAADIGTNNYLTHPEKVREHMQTAAKPNTPVSPLSMRGDRAQGVEVVYPIRPEQVASWEAIDSSPFATGILDIIHQNVHVPSDFESKFDDQGKPILTTEDGALPNLLLSTQLIKLGNGIRVIEVRSHAAFLYEEGQEEQPLFTVGLVTRLPASEAWKDSRIGLGVSSYDNAEADLTTLDNKSLALRLPRRLLRKFDRPVTLGPKWEEKDTPNALEIAGRALWQAADAELNSPNLNRPYIKDKTLKRVRDYLGVDNPAAIYDLADDLYHANPIVKFRLEGLQRSLLVLMLASPHRFVEYTGKSGIWNLLLPHGGPKWEEVLERLNTRISADDYRAILRQEKPVPPGFQSGLEMMSAIITSSPLPFGEKKTGRLTSDNYLANMFSFTHINLDHYLD